MPAPFVLFCIVRALVTDHVITLALQRKCPRRLCKSPRKSRLLIPASALPSSEHSQQSPSASAPVKSNFAAPHRPLGAGGGMASWETGRRDVHVRVASRTSARALDCAHSPDSAQFTICFSLASQASRCTSKAVAMMGATAQKVRTYRGVAAPHPTCQWQRRRIVVQPDLGSQRYRDKLANMPPGSCCIRPLPR